MGFLITLRISVLLRKAFNTPLEPQLNCLHLRKYSATAIAHRYSMSGVINTDNAIQWHVSHSLLLIIRFSFILRMEIGEEFHWNKITLLRCIIDIIRDIYVKDLSYVIYHDICGPLRKEKFEIINSACFTRSLNVTKWVSELH